ncbi:MAG: T9SS type A sorting domain-containing protein [bacterium]|nr:T9SS type A sorting domain-containing protein [bacterium]
MKRTSFLLCSLLLILGAGETVARGPDVDTARPVMVEVTPQTVDNTTFDSTAKVLYYPIYTEDFESGPGGWISHDLTEVVPHWQTSDFNAANLDPGTGNKAWWCGANFAVCDALEEPGGYGPGYDDILEWRGTVPNPVQPTNVSLTAVLNHDLEANYDFLYLEFWTASGWVTYEYWTDRGSAVASAMAVILDPADYIDDQILLRWRVESDAFYDSADCNWINEGAAQIDNIAVSFNGSLVGDIETCEDGTTPAWTPIAQPGVGDFAQLMDNVIDADSCSERENMSHRWVFVDDGLVVPGTGGTIGEVWNYGPGGYVVNHSGGVLGAGNYIWNEVWSPIIDYNPGGATGNGGIVAFDYFLHIPFGTSGFTGVVGTYRIRSTADPSADPDVDPELWSDWSSMANYYYSGGPYNRRFELDVSHLLEPNCAQIQIALGVQQLSAYYYGTSQATPSPYFDNVEVIRYEAPFIITAWEVDLAQDAGPTAVDLVNLSNNRVRFDSARDIGDPAGHADRGDSLVITVSSLQTGGAPPVEVRMHYFCLWNPIYENHRGTGLPSEGSVRCSTTDDIKFFADLPDSGFIYPGDVLHYWFEADNGVGVIASYPEDLTGYDDFSHTSPYPEHFTFRALPSHDLEGEVPRTLYWNDSGLIDDYNDWPEAMVATGLFPGTGYDTYRTGAPGFNGRNGLGGVSPGVLSMYDTIVYSGGAYSYNALEEGDIAQLDAFLRLGDRNLILAGDHTVGTLSDSPLGLDLLAKLGVQFASADVGTAIGSRNPHVLAVPGNSTFDEGREWDLDGSCPYAWVFDAITTDGAEMLAEFSSPGAWSYAAATRQHWAVYNSTMIVFPYDLNRVDTTAKSALLMSFVLEDVFISLDYGAVPVFLPTCDLRVLDGAVEVSWPVSASTELDDFRLEASGRGTTRVVPHVRSAPDRFTALDDAPAVASGGVFTYTLHQADAQAGWLAIDRSEIDVAAAPLMTRLIGASPNPFNPGTEVAFALDKRQRVEVSVYDLGGRRVATLLQEVFDAGTHRIAWNGLDAAGQRASSGVYFVRMQTPSRDQTAKITLMK